MYQGLAFFARVISNLFEMEEMNVEEVANVKNEGEEEEVWLIFNNPDSSIV